LLCHQNSSDAMASWQLGTGRGVCDEAGNCSEEPLVIYWWSLFLGGFNESRARARRPEVPGIPIRSESACLASSRRARSEKVSVK
jgi:hypothetical protein